MPHPAELFALLLANFSQYKNSSAGAGARASRELSGRRRARARAGMPRRRCRCRAGGLPPAVLLLLAAAAGARGAAGAARRALAGVGGAVQGEYVVPREDKGEVERRGAVDGRIHEASGLAASRRHAGVVYTHNDSGDGPRVFALSAADGALLGEYEVRGRPGAAAVEAHDWEDMAVGPCGFDAALDANATYDQTANATYDQTANATAFGAGLDSADASCENLLGRAGRGPRTDTEEQASTSGTSATTAAGGRPRRCTACRSPRPGRAARAAGRSRTGSCGARSARTWRSPPTSVTPTPRPSLSTRSPPTSTSCARPWTSRCRSSSRGARCRRTRSWR